jgi:hypothetical protein
MKNTKAFEQIEGPSFFRATSMLAAFFLLFDQAAEHIQKISESLHRDHDRNEGKRSPRHHEKYCPE